VIVSWFSRAARYFGIRQQKQLSSVGFHPSHFPPHTHPPPLKKFTKSISSVRNLSMHEAPIHIDEGAFVETYAEFELSFNGEIFLGTLHPLTT
jgi:hypothetical protein